MKKGIIILLLIPFGVKSQTVLHYKNVLYSDTVDYYIENPTATIDSGKFIRLEIGRTIGTEDQNNPGTYIASIVSYYFEIDSIYKEVISGNKIETYYFIGKEITYKLRFNFTTNTLLMEGIKNDKVVETKIFVN